LTNSTRGLIVTNTEGLDHRAVLEQAFAVPGNTAVVLPTVAVNRVLRERYEVLPPVEFSVDTLWDMEVRKAHGPDVYLPHVVAPGSLEVFPTVRHGRFEDFTRVSRQRLWAAPETFGLVIEHVRLDHDEHRAFFLGAAEFDTPDGRRLVAGAGQPLFHVEHSVSGSATAPGNDWRIVHLTTTPDPVLRQVFLDLGAEEHLRPFIEVYLRRDLGRVLRRR
jgi:hypothetical protein